MPSLRRVGREAEAVEAADIVVLDQDVRRRRRSRPRAPPCRAGAASARSCAGRRNAASAARAARPTACPRWRACAPASAAGSSSQCAAVRHERPGADVGDAVRQRVDVAVGAVGERHLVGEPVVGDACRHRS